MLEADDEGHQAIHYCAIYDRSDAARAILSSEAGKQITVETLKEAAGLALKMSNQQVFDIILASDPGVMALIMG